MNAKERCKMRRKLRRASEREGSQKDIKLAKSIATSLSGFSSRVFKATMSLPLRSKEQASADNICLADVAIFNAGYRKSVETVTAR
jgi:hypothetical protein